MYVHSYKLEIFNSDVISDDQRRSDKITCTILLYENFHVFPYALVEGLLYLILVCMVVLITNTIKNEELPGVTHVRLLYTGK